ncbi:MAG: NTP transferase domain-containing protein [Propionibacteriaceae bacterium]|nr:NTP transferase domain-containing protein [Propionibacteriaceae bacterium]
MGVSLGLVNSTVNKALDAGYLSIGEQGVILTKAGQEYRETFQVDNAIILAAGFGSRFVPYTYETPKGLLKVKGVPMVERQITQLKEAGINEIIIVVGHLKESFDYLIDKYGVQLVYNREYATKNNFVSLYYVQEHLKNTYLLVSDHWINDSIFQRFEAKSWYSCVYVEGPTSEWAAKPGPRDRIDEITIGGNDDWVILGPAYFTEDFSRDMVELINTHYVTPGTDNDYWEDIVKDNIDTLPPMFMNKQVAGNVFEFENLEELRVFDDSYNRESTNDTMNQIAETFGITPDMVYGIEPLKDGVTNLSFVFHVDHQGYVFRTPGSGTNKLINRFQEKAAYEAISSLGISDEIVRFDADHGTKITKHFGEARLADPTNIDDLREVARLLRSLHTSGVSLEFDFDIRAMISNYRLLAEDVHAIRFSDFDQVAQNMETLLEFKDRLGVSPVVCHGECEHTNVLIFDQGPGKLIDWEYAGMADPILDIATFGIQALMGRSQMEDFLRIYLEGEPTSEELARLYLYVALGGFLWSIWAEYRQAVGQEFGEFPLKMYRYAKDYFSILSNEGYLDEVTSLEGAT